MPTNSFELSPSTRTLIRFLATVPHGGVVTNDQLSAELGRDIRKCRHLLYSAFNHIQRENGIIFGSLRGQGYQRLLVEQAPHVGSTARRKIRRTARQASKKLTAVLARANDVSNDVRIAANRELSVLGLLDVAAQDKNLPEAKNGVQPVADVSREFLDKISK